MKSLFAASLKAAASAASSADGVAVAAVVVAAAVRAAGAVASMGASSIAAVVPADASEDAGETGSLLSPSEVIWRGDKRVGLEDEEEMGTPLLLAKKNVDRYLMSPFRLPVSSSFQPCCPWLSLGRRAQCDLELHERKGETKPGKVQHGAVRASERARERGNLEVRLSKEKSDGRYTSRTLTSSFFSFFFACFFALTSSPL